MRGDSRQLLYHLAGPQRPCIRVTALDKLTYGAPAGSSGEELMSPIIVSDLFGGVVAARVAISSWARAA
jgi:ethanolamine transporter EutH